MPRPCPPSLNPPPTAPWPHVRRPPTRSAVRGAMVSIMLAAGSRRLEAPAPSSAPGSSEYSSTRPAEYGGVPERSGPPRAGEGGRWSEAVTAENGGALPRDARTCILWCAIALGALVRGCPFSIVGVASLPSSASSAAAVLAVARTVRAPFARSGRGDGCAGGSAVLGAAPFGESVFGRFGRIGSPVLPGERLEVGVGSHFRCLAATSCHARSLIS